MNNFLFGLALGLVIGSVTATWIGARAIRKALR